MALGVQGSNTGPLAGVVQFTPVIGAEWSQPTKPFRLSDPPPNPVKPYLSSVMVNFPTIGYVSSGSLSQGPQLSNLTSVGGVGAIGVNFGPQAGVTAEASLTHTWGSPVTGSDQSASSTTGRTGLIFTYNYPEKTTSGPRTTSISIGAWYSHEAGNVTGTPKSNAPTGGFTTNTAMFSLIVGFRQ